METGIKAVWRSVPVVLADTVTVLVVLQGHVGHGLLQASRPTPVFQQQDLETEAMVNIWFALCAETAGLCGTANVLYADDFILYDGV